MQLHLLHAERSRRGLPQSGNPRACSYFAPASKAFGPGREKPERLSQEARFVERGADYKCVLDQLARSAGSQRRADSLKFKASLPRRWDVVSASFPIVGRYGYPSIIIEESL
jgi:hypothetical protein